MNLPARKCRRFFVRGFESFVPGNPGGTSIHKTPRLTLIDLIDKVEGCIGIGRGEASPYLGFAVWPGILCECPCLVLALSRTSGQDVVESGSIPPIRKGRHHQLNTYDVDRLLELPRSTGQFDRVTLHLLAGAGSGSSDEST